MLLEKVVTNQNVFLDEDMDYEENFSHETQADETVVEEMVFEDRHSSIGWTEELLGMLSDVDEYGNKFVNKNGKIKIYLQKPLLT